MRQFFGYCKSYSSGSDSSSDSDVEEVSLTEDTQPTSNSGLIGPRCGGTPSFCRDPFRECTAQAELSELPTEPSRETCIFLDWDDTLLATSFINTVPDGEMTPMEEMQLQSLGRSVASLIKLARRLGRVWIVTNAGEGWVEQSSALFLPYVASVLEGVPVVSARSRFEETFPDDAFMWKKNAFLDVLRRLDLGTGANLVSIGDSLCEMLALKAMGEEFREPALKTVQFVSCPTLEELQQQQECLMGELARIVESETHLDIEMSRCCMPGGFSIAESVREYPT
jgi:hypothetical protein